MLSGPSAGAIVPVGDGMTLGRGSEVDSAIIEAGVSRRHARVERDGDRFTVEDLGSSNGTFVAGQRVRGRRELASGDRIQLGTTAVVRFDLYDEMEQQVLLDLFQSAVRDPLTKVHNRRYLDERLEEETSYASRHDRDLAVIMLDIDHFKQFNDQHGHKAGDAVLRFVAKLLRSTLRPEDLLARYGGEEFCVVARGLDCESATRLAERVREAIAGLHVPFAGQTLFVSASVGIASRRQRRDPSANRMLADADLALYRAKDEGRNRVCLHRPEGTDSSAGH